MQNTKSPNPGNLTISLKEIIKFICSRYLWFTSYNHCSLALKERDWNTLEFYRKNQDDLTPAGLAFYQSDWDPSVTQFYHSVLSAYNYHGSFIFMNLSRYSMHTIHFRIFFSQARKNQCFNTIFQNRI